MKKFLSIVTTLLLALMLVGCGATTQAPAGTTKAPAGTTKAPAGTTAAPVTTTEAPLPYETEPLGIELTEGDSYSLAFWHTWGQAKQKALQDMVAEFEKWMLDTYGVTVEITDTSAGDYATLLEKTNKAISSGSEDNMPNIVVGYPDHFAGYLKNLRLLSLEPYVYSTEYGVDPNLFVRSYMNENLQFNKTIYSLPFSKSGEILCYNKSIADALNIKVPYDKPLSWTELSKFANTAVGYKKTNEAGATVANIQFLVNYDSSDNLFINFARQLNAKYTTGKGELLVKDQTTVSMIKTIQQMHQRKWLSVPIDYEDTANYGSTYFKQQQMLFTIGSTAGSTYNIVADSDISETNKIYEKFEVGFGFVPQFETGVDGKAGSGSIVQQGPNIALLDCGTDEDKLVSWLFIKYMTTMNKYDPSNANADENGFVPGQDNSARFAIATGYFPVTEQAFESQLYTEYMGIAKRYFENGYSTEGFTDKELGNLALSEVAYIGYLQRKYYKYDPAFAASSSLMGSAQIRIEAGNCINKIMNDDQYDAATALQEMVDACTIH